MSLVKYNDAGTALIFRLEAGQIGVTATTGPELYNNTQGLMGTYDNNIKNDFTLPNGTVLASDIGTETIYSQFGEACKIFL